MPCPVPHCPLAEKPGPPISSPNPQHSSTLLCRCVARWCRAASHNREQSVPPRRHSLRREAAKLTEYTATLISRSDGRASIPLPRLLLTHEGQDCWPEHLATHILSTDAILLFISQPNGQQQPPPPPRPHEPAHDYWSTLASRPAPHMFPTIQSVFTLPNSSSKAARGY